MRKQAVFGPGGNSEAFYAAGYKSSLQAPLFVSSLGLLAYEFEAGRGMRGVTETTLSALGAAAREHGVELSLHAPYFISLSSSDPETRKKSVDYIAESVNAALVMGADTVVIHMGGAAKMTRAEAMDLSARTLDMTLSAVGDTPVHLGLETMGKINQLGTLEEVLTLCARDAHFYPVVDFGHLNARERGGAFPDADSYRRVFDAVAARLGDDKARFMHCHFSKIEYTDAGEKRHLTLADEIYGPDFLPLAEAIAREGLCPRIISESAGTQSDDALTMQRAYEAARKGAY